MAWLRRALGLSGSQAVPRKVVVARNKREAERALRRHGLSRTEARTRVRTIGWSAIITQDAPGGEPGAPYPATRRNGGGTHEKLTRS